MTTRTQYYVAASLDGRIAESDDGLAWLTDIDDGTTPEGEEPQPGSYERFIENVGAIVMGGRTYDVVTGGLVEAWPYAGLPTFVYAHRERPVMEGADVRFVSGDVRDHHDAVVAAANGRNVWLEGGGALASQYLDAGLLDDLLLALTPVWLGDGIPLFAGRHLEPLRLTGVDRFRSGLVLLRYEVPRGA